MKDVPAATLAFQFQVVEPGCAVNIKGWPEGMTPSRRTEPTAFESQETWSGEHCYDEVSLIRTCQAKKDWRTLTDVELR